jgi:hypothetical protein
MSLYNHPGIWKNSRMIFAKDLMERLFRLSDHKNIMNNYRKNNYIKKWNTDKRRRTGLYLLAPAGRGYEKPQSGYRPLCGFSPPHFCGCWKPAVSFIATAKSSDTAGTLGAIRAETY